MSTLEFKTRGYFILGKQMVIDKMIKGYMTVACKADRAGNKKLREFCGRRAHRLEKKFIDEFGKFIKMWKEYNDESEESEM